MDSIYQNLPVLFTALPMLFAALAALVSRRSFAVIIYALNNFILLALSILAIYKTQYGSSITYNMGDWLAPYGIEHVITNGKALLLLVIWLVAFITVPLSYKLINTNIERRKGALFYCTVMLALAGLTGMVLANDIFNIYVFLEISSLATYALIGAGKRKKALVAAYNYLIVGTVAGGLILFGIALIYAEIGSLNISDIKRTILSGKYDYSLESFNFAFVFLFLGFALKAALFPLSGWLPAVYKYAPIFVVILLSAFATKVAFFVMLQFISIFKLTEIWTIELRYIILAMALTGMVLSSIKACFKDEIRTILAYSSIANISYILLAIALDNPIAYAAAFYHIFFHGITKAALYSLISPLLNEKGVVNLLDIKGLAYNKPFKAGLFVLLSIILVGVPGTAIFFTKWLLIESSLTTELPMAALAIAGVLISSLLSFIYMWRIIESIFQRKVGDTKNKEKQLDIVAYTVLFLALPSIYFGFYSNKLFEYANLIIEGAM